MPVNDLPLLVSSFFSSCSGVSGSVILVSCADVPDCCSAAFSASSFCATCSFIASYLSLILFNLAVLVWSFNRPTQSSPLSICSLVKLLICSALVASTSIPLFLKPSKTAFTSSSCSAWLTSAIVLKSSAFGSFCFFSSFSTLLSIM